MLSAYVDNELSEGEIKKLEDELKFSKELQEKLNELKKVKQLTLASVKGINENPYFDTRLSVSMRNDGPWLFRLKKFYPVISIVALSILLMVVLKYNPGIINNLVEKQKSNITDFYKQNLKPLLYAADLTNEDIFNFAFYHQLPLDNSKRQYLYLGSSPNGNKYFEIKNSGQDLSGNNLEKFIKGLNLNTVQKHQVDSILSSYADNLQSQVLVNEKNTVAINPNIWNFNKALVADLVSFAAKANKQRMQNVLPAGFENYCNRSSIAQLVSEVNSINGNNYIFITPDTIFSDSFYFDKGKFNEDMKRLKDEMKKANKENKNFVFNFHLDSNLVKLNDIPSMSDFKIFFDSNSCRIHLPQMIVPQIPMKDFDSIAINLGKAGDLFKMFSFDFPDMNKGKNFNYKYYYSDSAKGLKFNFKAFRFDTSFNFNNRKLNRLYGKNFKKFGFANPDSIAELYKEFFSDSTAFNQKELEKELQQVQKQIELFQKQMQQLQKQIPNNKKETTTAKQIEI